MPRVLVIEDSETIREMVSEALADVGYHTDACCDGDCLEEALDGLRPDLVVLDVMLPGRDGFALVDVIREWGDTGIVLITARDGLQDRLRGLDGGADDYVVKPFELHRTGIAGGRGAAPARTVAAGNTGGRPDAGRRSRCCCARWSWTGSDGDRATATCLPVGAARKDRQCRPDPEPGLGYDAYDPNLVQVHVSSLRRKLEAHGPRILHTIRGIGYRLQPQRP